MILAEGENFEIIGAMSTAIVALAGTLAKVTMMLLKEKDSKLKMLREFYELTKKGGGDG